MSGLEIARAIAGVGWLLYVIASIFVRVGDKHKEAEQELEMRRDWRLGREWHKESVKERELREQWAEARQAREAREAELVRTREEERKHEAELQELYKRVRQSQSPPLLSPISRPSEWLWVALPLNYFI